MCRRQRWKTLHLFCWIWEQLRQLRGLIAKPEKTIRRQHTNENPCHGWSVKSQNDYFLNSTHTRATNTITSRTLKQRKTKNRSTTVNKPKAIEIQLDKAPNRLRFCFAFAECCANSAVDNRERPMTCLHCSSSYPDFPKP